MLRHLIGAAGCALTLALAASGDAQAVELKSFSQAVVVSSRCSGTAAFCWQNPGPGAVSDGTGPDFFNPAPNFSVGSALSGAASARGEFAGTIGLSTLHSGSFATNSVDGYAESFVLMGQGYTWTGAGRDLSLGGALDYSLDTNPALDPNHSSPGQASVSASIWLLSAEAITDITHPIRSLNRIQSAGGLAPCGVDGVLAAATYSEYQTSGPGSAFLDVSNTCGGDPFHVATGDQFYVFAILHTTAVTGGAADALNTFRVTIAPADLLAASNYMQASTPGAVPEPASWAMLLLGFGGLGGVMRRRRARLAAA